MDAEEFRKHKLSLANSLKEEPKNLNKENSNLISCITSHYYEFNQKRNDAALIENIPKDTLLEFYRENILDFGTRSKLSCHVKSVKCIDNYSDEVRVFMGKIKDGSMFFDSFEDLEAFTKTLPLSEYPKPVQNLQDFYPK